MGSLAGRRPALQFKSRSVRGCGRLKECQTQTPFLFFFFFWAYFAFQGLQTNLATSGPPNWQGEEGIEICLFLWLRDFLCFLQGFKVLASGLGERKGTLRVVLRWAFGFGLSLPAFYKECVSTSRYVLHEPIDSSCCTSKRRGEVPIKHLHWLSLFVLVRCRDDLTLCGAGGGMSAASLSPRGPCLLREVCYGVSTLV